MRNVCVRKGFSPCHFSPGSVDKASEGERGKVKNQEFNWKHVRNRTAPFCAPLHTKCALRLEIPWVGSSPSKDSIEGETQLGEEWLRGHKGGTHWGNSPGSIPAAPEGWVGVLAVGGIRGVNFARRDTSECKASGTWTCLMWCGLGVARVEKEGRWSICQFLLNSDCCECWIKKKKKALTDHSLPLLSGLFRGFFCSVCILS